MLGQRRDGSKEDATNRRVVKNLQAIPGEMKFQGHTISHVMVGWVERGLNGEYGHEVCMCIKGHPI